jgi:hypothetical protein
MRKLGLIAAASLLVPVAAQAKPLNELLLDKGVLGAADVKKDAGPARLTYDNGPTLEFPSAGATWKLNTRLQTLYTYTDFDGGNDSSSFDVRNVRLDLSGTVMNKEFSWRVTNDFTTDTDSGTSGSKLQDAYIDWDPCEGQKARAGQWATPFGRQWTTENQNLQFIDRSIATQNFNFGRQAGVGYMGDIGESFHHQVAVFNGNSFNEGQNVSGADPLLIGIYSAALDLDGSYDRTYEGDPTNSTGSAGLGLSAYYGQSRYTAGGATSATSTGDEFGASLDLGYRGDGLSLQVEGFYQGLDVDGFDETQNNYGLYAQAGYFVVPSEWEVAARFGWVTFDDDFAGTLGRSNGQAPVLSTTAGLEDVYEVNALVSYYINGHNLKVMTGPSWIVSQPKDGEDLSDFRYQVGLFGYF